MISRELEFTGCAIPTVTHSRLAAQQANSLPAMFQGYTQLTHFTFQQSEIGEYARDEYLISQLPCDGEGILQVRECRVRLTELSLQVTDIRQRVNLHGKLADLPSHPEPFWICSGAANSGVMALNSVRISCALSMRASSSSRCRSRAV